MKIKINNISLNFYSLKLKNMITFVDSAWVRMCKINVISTNLWIDLTMINFRFLTVKGTIKSKSVHLLYEFPCHLETVGLFFLHKRISSNKIQNDSLFLRWSSMTESLCLRIQG